MDEFKELNELTAYDVAEAIGESMARGDIDDLVVEDMLEPSALEFETRFEVKIFNQWFTITVQQNLTT